MSQKSLFIGHTLTYSFIVSSDVFGQYLMERFIDLVIFKTAHGNSSVFFRYLDSACVTHTTNLNHSLLAINKM